MSALESPFRTRFEGEREKTSGIGPIASKMGGSMVDGTVRCSGEITSRSKLLKGSV